MSNTDEDDEFDRILRENRIKAQPYYFSPQTKWLSLTDEEIQTVWDSAMDGAVFTRRNIYNAIETKLKEKNT